MPCLEWYTLICELTIYRKQYIRENHLIVHIFEKQYGISKILMICSVTN